MYRNRPDGTCFSIQMFWKRSCLRKTSVWRNWIRKLLEIPTKRRANLQRRSQTLPRRAPLKLRRRKRKKNRRKRQMWQNLMMIRKWRMWVEQLSQMRTKVLIWKSVMISLRRGRRRRRRRVRGGGRTTDEKDVVHAPEIIHQIGGLVETAADIGHESGLTRGEDFA